jgi:uracil phosphoribosyltransferase
MEQFKNHPNIHIMSHPLISHKLAILRDERTGTQEFRKVVSELATLMTYEATRNMPTEEVEIKTPVGMAKCQVLSGKKVAIVPILRAGLGMVDGILTLLPSAKVGHIGLYRDPKTLKPVEYFCKMPPDIAERDILLVDPMLATGGSGTAAIQFMKNYGCKKITMLNLLAAPEGLELIARDHPDVEVFVAAMDDHLNEHGYIVPGLGDAGDRIFGTK